MNPQVSITYTWTVDLIKPVIATTAQGGNKDVIQQSLHQSLTREQPAPA
jgi:hypothetical protein